MDKQKNGVYLFSRSSAPPSYNYSSGMREGPDATRQNLENMRVASGCGARRGVGGATAPGDGVSSWGGENVRELTSGGDYCITL